MATIAFIGLGNMGGPMAANLVKAGHKVVAFDLAEASRNQAKADGAGIADSAAGAVKGADVVVTMLPAGKHVLGVWGEVVPAMTKGTLIIDSSTIDVESARQAHALAAKYGVLSVDAPVSGGTGGAKGATRSPSCAAARTTRLQRQSPCWRTWARRSCIAAGPAQARRQKSATT
ncbi:3-hydroxyisobutyrate dehydrogenase-like beta-hydroxyacid dehydrogenase [Bradyrhizobium sp. F1.13.1]